MDMQLRKHIVMRHNKNEESKRKTSKHIIHRKQNILVKCKLGSGRLVRLTTRDGNKIDRHNLTWCHIKIMFVSCNLTEKMYMVYPDKIYVASADGLGPVSTSESAVPTLNNFIQSDIRRTFLGNRTKWEDDRFLPGIIGWWNRADMSIHRNWVVRAWNHTHIRCVSRNIGNCLISEI